MPPTVTVTEASATAVDAPDSVTVPATANPSRFSAMLTVSSPAIVSRLSASVPTGRTVTVNSVSAPFQSSVSAAVAVTLHSPASTSVSAPVAAFTVHTSGDSVP